MASVRQIISRYESLREIRHFVSKEAKIVHIDRDTFGEILIVSRNEDVLKYMIDGKELRKLSELCGKGVRKFDSGYGHWLALTERGEVYAWGNNIHGELGNGSADSQTQPQLVSDLPAAKKICCGEHHSLVLTMDGQVYAFGDNYYGQTGVPAVERLLRPVRVRGALDGQRVADIACGLRHSLALLESGEVCSWGWNGRCQLGLRHIDTPDSIPAKIQLPADALVSKVACGPYNSMLLSRSGQVYTFGCNMWGQIGADTGGVDAYTPVLLTCLPTGVRDIAATKFCKLCVAIVNSGRCWVWGECGNQIVNRPSETDNKSIEEAFANLSRPQITRETTQLIRTDPLHTDL